MHINFASSILGFIGMFIALASGSFSHAQDTSDWASLPKNSFIWTQEEMELGFLHYDKVFGNSREVPCGDNVYQLQKGLPIAGFSNGGEKEEEIEDFMIEQKVAGLLILQDGKIRLESYALGHSEASRWTSHSVAKSVTSTLVGAAIKDGYIGSVDDLITDYIPDLKGSAYDSVTIHQVLTMTTGVRWKETYNDPDSDLIKYWAFPVEPGIDQTVNYLRNLPAESEPGTKFNYNTAETHLLGVLVSNATGQTLSDYLSTKIWIPYGMEQNASWNLSVTDQELAGCCLQVKTRDYARYGQFVLDDGRINGESIVPDDWFQSATKMQFPIGFGWGYGYQWWVFLNGTFQALGVHGQMIHIDPSRRLVVVINSAWPEAESYERRMAVDNFLLTIQKEIDK